MSLVINYTSTCKSLTMNKLGKMVKMRDIVDSKYIVNNQDEILAVGDLIPSIIFKYISRPKIYQYFEYNTKNNEFFANEFKTFESWLESEKSVYDFYDFPGDTIDFLEEWVECYPQFEGVLNRKYFDEFLENDGVVDQSEELGQIERRFHKLIMKRAGKFVEKYQMKLPHITPDLLDDGESFKQENFPIPYGGFYYTLTIENGEYLLNVESWSRVVEGSGEYHEITKDSCKLVAEGFV